MTQRTVTSRVKIDWLPWGPKIFERAEKQDKLILLDSGATWCHWCHVMDRVTYEDPEVVRMVNEKFVPVRIDRDRLPDVDAKYQRAAALISPGGSAGGWPLTVLITPEGYTLFKGTFLPPRADGRYGATIGLIELLELLDREWRDNRRKITEAGERIRREVTEHYSLAYTRPGSPSQELIDEIYAGIKGTYDPQNGGLGGAPKFFNASAMELLLVRAWGGDAAARGMLTKTLESIGRGGVYDQIGGGFHRYSVDARWSVPHFEKMAYDNAAMLANYANAHALTHREDFARIARETLKFIQRVLTDPQRRGFYASQDADVGLNDDGDYFTWTPDEFRAALSDDADLIIEYYDVDPTGDMHGRSGRNVLHILKTPSQLAKLLNRDEDEIIRTVESATEKLLQVRLKRVAPNVDRTFFADLNGMMIDAHLIAYERLGDETPRKVALKILDNLLDSLRDEDAVFAHYREGEKLRGLGMLSDQVWMGWALLHAYQLTLDPKYLRAASKLGDFILENLTVDDGGFLSTPSPEATHPGAIQPMRSWEDAPSRSAASVAAQMLIDLGYLSGQEKYAAAGAKALASFAGAVDKQWGPFLGGYALAMDHRINGPRSVIIVGAADHPATKELVSLARKSYVPSALVIAIDPAVETHADLLKRLGYAAAERPVAYVCRGKLCLQPAHTPPELRERIDELRRGS